MTRTVEAGAVVVIDSSTSSPGCIDRASALAARLDAGGAWVNQHPAIAAGDWPKAEARRLAELAETQAKLQCPKSWAAFVGAPYETSRFEMAFDLPDQATWGNGIRHVIGCLVVDPQGELITGSVRGSGK